MTVEILQIFANFVFFVTIFWTYTSVKTFFFSLAHSKNIPHMKRKVFTRWNQPLWLEDYLILVEVRSAESSDAFENQGNSP